MTDFGALLRALHAGGVECILVGGVAATVHGASRLTQDVDVVYRRSPETIARGLNFTLTTDIGDVDLLGDIVGGGGYDDLLGHSIVIQVFGLSMRCLGLERLIHVKRAAGRPKDLEAIAELEVIREERARGPG